MKRIAFGAVMFVLGAVAVAVAGAGKPDPIVPPELCEAMNAEGRGLAARASQLFERPAKSYKPQELGLALRAVARYEALDVLRVRFCGVKASDPR